MYEVRESDVLKIVGFKVVRGDQSSFHHYLGLTTTDEEAVTYDILLVGLFLDSILGVYPQNNVIICRPTELID